MSLLINAKSYTPDSFGLNAVGYIGPAHTASVLDDVRLARTLAKPTPVFSGIARTSAKFTRTHALTGALTLSGTSIDEVNFNVPVGTSAADIDSLCTDIGAFISSASFKAHVKGQQISF